MRAEKSVPINSARAALIVHSALEALAYALAFVLYRRARSRETTTAPLSPQQNLGLLVGAAVGALVGAKLLAWMETPPGPFFRAGWTPFALQGKTIVGGLLGGWVGVEIVKRRLGISRPTGDAVVPAFLAGLAVGRLGCFLAGAFDRTYGIATDLPWGVDFGDGVRRHPTQLYEIVFLGLLAAALTLARRAPRPCGEAFLLMVAAYLGFRFGVEFLKPRRFLVGWLSAIQLASLLGAAVALTLLARRQSAWVASSRAHARA
jgi:phosphatidylglycerol:prolipoprotein diacylglycerol transferase